jgi:hypothetical protein
MAPVGSYNLSTPTQKTWDLAIKSIYRARGLVLSPRIRKPLLAQPRDVIAYQPMIPCQSKQKRCLVNILGGRDLDKHSGVLAYNTKILVHASKYPVTPKDCLLYLANW